MTENTHLDRRTFLKRASLVVGGVVAVAVVTTLDKFFPRTVVAAAPPAALPGVQAGYVNGPAVAGVEVLAVSSSPDDPEYAAQTNLFELAGGMAEFEQAQALYRQMYELSHGTGSFPDSSTSDPYSTVAILGSGMGLPASEPTPDTFALDTFVDYTHPLATDFIGSSGGNPNAYDEAQYDGTSQLAGPYARTDNATGLAGVLPCAPPLVPIKIRHPESTPYQQTKALSEALFQVNKNAHGINVVVVDAQVNANVVNAVSSIQNLAQKGIYVVVSSTNGPNSFDANPLAVLTSIRDNVFVVGGSNKLPPAGVTTDVKAPWFNVRTFLNPRGDISDVSGERVSAAQIGAVLGMVQSLRPDGAAFIPVPRLKQLLTEYAVDQDGNFVHLEAFIRAVASEYTLIEPTPTPSDTPTPKPTDTSTPQPSDTPTPKPTDTSTPQPSDTPTPKPTDTPTATPTPTGLWRKIFLPFLQRS